MGKKTPRNRHFTIANSGDFILFCLHQMLSAGRTAEALDQRLLVHCKLIAALGTFHLIERALGAVEILVHTHALLRLIVQVADIIHLLLQCSQRIVHTIGDFT